MDRGAIISAIEAWWPRRPAHVTCVDLSSTDIETGSPPKQATVWRVDMHAQSADRGGRHTKALHFGGEAAALAALLEHGARMLAKIAEDAPGVFVKSRRGKAPLKADPPITHDPPLSEEDRAEHARLTEVYSEGQADYAPPQGVSDYAHTYRMGSP